MIWLMSIMDCRVSVNQTEAVPLTVEAIWLSNCFGVVVLDGKNETIKQQRHHE